MARAVAVITGVSSNPDGTIIVKYSVSTDSGLNFSADAPVSLLQTIPQFMAAARTKVSADCLSKGDVVLTADITICGGPS